MQKLCASGQWDHLVHDHVSNNCKNGEHHVVYRRNHSRVERVQSLQSNKRVKRHNKDYAEEFKHRFVYVFCFILVINLKFWFFHLETWIVCYLRPWEKKCYLWLDDNLASWNDAYTYQCRKAWQHTPSVPEYSYFSFFPSQTF